MSTCSSFQVRLFGFVAAAAAAVGVVGAAGSEAAAVRERRRNTAGVAELLSPTAGPTAGA